MGSTLSFFNGNQPSKETLQFLSRNVIIQNNQSSSPRCGLYISHPDIIKLYPQAQFALPLLNIDYNIQIINHLAKISLTQSYQNFTQLFLETEYSFPIDPKIVVHQFRAKFQNVIMSGEVKEKKQAKQEYQKGLAEGKAVSYAEIDKDSYDIMNMKIGNIPPKTKVTIEIQFVQELDVEMNTLYKLKIPSVINPRYINEPKDQSDNWRKQLPKSFVSQQNPKYTWSFNLKVISESPLKFNNSSTHELLQTSINQTQTEASFILSDNEVPNKDFIFVYSNQAMASCTLGITDTHVCAGLSFIPKYAELKADDAFKMMMKDEKYEVDMQTASGQYIFLLDRSGSMSGSRMNKAKQALKLFLKSLPSKTLFDIVSFGSHYECMFNQSVSYTDQNLNFALNKLQGFSANFGGTEIKSALEFIFNKKVIPNYPRQIFLLTDGEVDNTNAVIQLVKENIKYSRLYTIGVGNGCSTALIKGCAEKGKGKAVFITDDGDIASPVIQLLTASLTPIITSFKLDYDQSIIQSIIPNPNSMPFILKDEPVNFYIIFKKEFRGKTIFNLKYTQSVHNIPFQNQIVVNTQANNLNFDFIDKVAQHKMISVMIEKMKNKHLLDQDLLIAKVQDLQKEIVKRSIRSQVLCPLTAFICVGKKLEDGKYIQFLSKGQQVVIIPQYKSVDSDNVMRGGPPGAFACYSSSRPQQAAYGSVQSFSSVACTGQKSFMSPPTASLGMNFSPIECIIPQPCSIQPQNVSKSFNQSNQKKKSFFSNLFGNEKQIDYRPATTTFSPRQQQNNLFGISQPQATSFAPQPPPPSMDSLDFFSQPQSISKAPSPQLNNLFGASSQPQFQQNLFGSKSPSIQLSSSQSNIEYIISKQRIDGSWQCSSELISKLFPSQSKQLAQLSQSLGLNSDVLVSIVIINWIKINHNNSVYSLIIKKGQNWISKKLKEINMDQQVESNVLARIKVE